MAQNSEAFEKLKNRLKTMFQLDRGDLDFGIYRIMNQKSAEIAEFLDNRLLPQVRAVLAGYQPAELAHKRRELQEAEAKPHKYSAEYIENLRQRVSQGFDAGKLENEIYADLYNFFGRYYDEGDFMALRRYKAGVYALPYEGEEVKLYWANADQYYIKTTENFAHYRFKTGEGKTGKYVHFEVAQAGAEANNNKAASDKERRFILAKTAPLAAAGDELTLRFDYRADESKRKQAEINKETAERVKATPEAAEFGLNMLAPTEKDKSRTILAKHLTAFTAKNSFDYFIHKDLGGFLRRELDFFIKNEIMHLDDIEAGDVPRVESYLAKIKAMRHVAGKIIQFLAQLENFQKTLWLKKKFVLKADYCITLDKILEKAGEKEAEKLLAEIAANDAQRQEWEKLFAIAELQADLAGGAGLSRPLSAEFLRAHDKLPVDTQFFDASFKYRLLSLFDNLDEQTDGLLIESENFQALNLLQERYKEQVKCIYIDPPYNTEGDRREGKFLYKDNYAHASWLAMMDTRLKAGRELCCDDAATFISIDNNEQAHLKLLGDVIFGEENFIENFLWVKTSTPPSLSKKSRKTNEYVLCYEKARGEISYNAGDVEGGDQPLLNAGNAVRDLHFPIGSIAFNKNEFPDGQYESVQADRVSVLETFSIRGGKNVSPVVLKGEFKWTQPFLDDELDKGTQFVIKSKNFAIRFIRYEVRQKRPNNFIKEHIITPLINKDTASVGTNESAAKELYDILGEASFDYPKPTSLIQFITKFITSNKDIILDYFAGSGTTGHAVINLNRADNGARKYILVEMGGYFNSVLKPRILKAAYAREWKNGKPASHDSGISQMIKYMALEQYEDTLDNLTLERSAAQETLLDQHPALKEQYLLSYMLEAESRQSLLNIDKFANPFAYELKIIRDDAPQHVKVDLIETFNYLLGLRVRHCNCAPEKGIAAIEGINAEGEECLILWRDTALMDNDALHKWLEKRDYSTTRQEFAVIYVNGDNDLENRKQADEFYKVRLIEAEFKRLMFAEQNS